MNESKYINISIDVPQDKLETVDVNGEFIEVECELSFRGKTNSYFREQTFIDMIVQGDGRIIKGVWEEEWTEIAPGIETRMGNIGTCENYKRETIRIHCSACPLYVHFSESSEYIDYDGDFSGSHGREYWIKYEMDLIDIKRFRGKR